jgi:hypothetical protein
MTDAVYRFTLGELKPSLMEFKHRLSDLLSYISGSIGNNLTFIDRKAEDMALKDVDFSERFLRLARALRYTLKRSAFTRTRGNRPGLCYLLNDPCLPRPGDEVWVLFGCHMPMILRPKLAKAASPPGRYFSVIGPAVFPGFMNGEACVGLLPDGSPGPQYKGSAPEQINLI